ncbi:MAG: HEAT repeat domain-containing protein [Nitrospinaceae bacterium]
MNAASEEGPLFIQYRNSLLSVDIRGAHLPTVVRELRKKTGIKFKYTLLPDQPIYEKFFSFPLEAGIRRAIPFSTLFVYHSPAAQAPSREQPSIKSVFILSSLNPRPEASTGATRSSASPSPKSAGPDANASLKETGPEAKPDIGSLARQAQGAAAAYKWLLQLQDKNPQKRMEAVTQLAKMGSNSFSIKGLYLALQDKDARVRQAAGQKLTRLDEQNVFQTIKNELGQSEPTVQKHALDVIKLQRGAQWAGLLRQAVQTGQIDPSLRATAQGILAGLQAQSGGN